MILSGRSIKERNIIQPFVDRGVIRGRSFGCSIASYDCRVQETFYLDPGEFRLASTIEKFEMPNDVLGTVRDKSSWARRGLQCFNTVIDPGWKGFLTLEMVNHGHERLRVTEGDPIVQIVFEEVDYETEGYKGKYQDQQSGPQEARFEI